MKTTTKTETMEGAKVFTYRRFSVKGGFIGMGTGVELTNGRKIEYGQRLSKREALRQATMLLDIESRRCDSCGRLACACSGMMVVR